MSLTLHDTLSRRKVAFTPRPDSNRITLYVCGPTVYNDVHIGNARPVVVFDALYRLLKAVYPDHQVVYARNVTDVDDKINAAAQAEGVPIREITERFAERYRTDMGRLGALPPDLEPRATEHIAPMRELIAALIGNGAAYAAEGHVLFDVTRYAAYGALSGRSLGDMIAGARVEVAPYKKNPQDFVLWKPSKPGEPEWPSPWGPGRPGWHIECSAMTEATLGLPVDIHGGGHDLIFPHHENEIAQACAAHGAEQPRAYARYWMHNGFLTMDAEKMSKSLGNVVRVRELLERWPGEVLRFALLSAHYRAPLDWTDALLEQAKKSLDRLYGALDDARRLTGEIGRGRIGTEADRAVRELLCDDLNTPGALSALFATSDRLRAELRAGQASAAAETAEVLVAEASLLGLLQDDPHAWFTRGADAGLSARIEALVAERVQVRAAKNWARADEIRAELTALNVEVLDGPGGTATWRLKA